MEPKPAAKNLTRGSLKAHADPGPCHSSSTGISGADPGTLGPEFQNSKSFKHPRPKSICFRFLSSCTPPEITSQCVGFLPGDHGHALLRYRRSREDSRIGN